MESAYYHIMARGNQKQQVFLEEGDFEKYLALLKHYKRKYKFKLYAWCLMPNHVHLVLEINNTAQLAKIMQGISLAYVRWFNKKYGKVGHLWQGRYKSLAMQKNEYVLDCINYIETNPIRANIKGRISDYKWSSNRARTLGEMPSLLDPLKF
jgi:putative transposase